MKTSAFLAALREQPHASLTFHAGSDSVPGTFHLTEVKRVSYATMDCGSVTHQWTETHFELWSPTSAALPFASGMAAEKFLRIVDRVQADLALDLDATARVHAAIGGHHAMLFDVAAVVKRGESLAIELTPDRTRCKAAERRVGSALGGCCGTNDPTAATAAPTCGCSSGAAAPTVACCA